MKIAVGAAVDRSFIQAIGRDAALFVAQFAAAEGIVMSWHGYD